MSKFNEEYGLMNKNFQYNQVVKIFNTTDKYIDGKVGKIVGKPFIGYCDIYIVDMGQAIYPDKPDTCFLLTEACLKPDDSIYTYDELCDLNPSCPKMEIWKKWICQFTAKSPVVIEEINKLMLDNEDEISISKLRWLYYSGILSDCFGMDLKKLNEIKELIEK